MVVMYEGVNEIVRQEMESDQPRRSKRQYTLDKEIQLDAIGLPTGIPDEFKAQNEVRAGLESILPWITINKKVAWINYIYYNQQRYTNYSSELFRALGEQLHATTTVAWQNRQVLEWMTAE